jgi:hypothetical protein
MLYPVMKKHILLFIAAWLSLFLFPRDAISFGGPLQVKNQFPLFLVLDPPFLETASYDHSLSVAFSYSSVFMVRSSPVWSVNLDMEVAELNFRYRKDILSLFELGIDIPFLSFNSGVMDDFISSYHNAFGFSDYGRSGRPSNAFLYEVRKNGVVIMKGENGGIGIGDIRLTAKRALLEGDPGVGIMANVELPTGNASKGYGSGSIDAGVALLLDKKITDRIEAHLNLGGVFPGNLKARETVALRSFVYAGACVEAALWKNVSLLGQVTAQGSPFPKMGIGSIDRTSVLLTFGGRYDAGKSSFELSFTEDPNTAGAPDFTVTFSFKRTF